MTAKRSLRSARKIPGVSTGTFPPPNCCPFSTRSPENNLDFGLFLVFNGVMVNTKDRATIVVYQSKDGGLEIQPKIEQDSVWLTQKLMAELFDVNIRTINEHLVNIFSTRELNKTSVVRKFRITAEDGKSYNTNHYNLDAIISIGYRVNSKEATQFRIWATRILKDHLLKGYTVNQKLLLSQKNKFKELQNTIDYLENKAKHDLLRSQGLELLSLVRDYTRSLNLLEQYDNKKFTKKKGIGVTKPLTIDLAQKVIENIRDSLSQSGKSLGMLGVDTGKKLDSIINNLNQTFAGTDLYPTLEEKAANLLYLTIKDHPFLDGNKRVGSMLFITFLDQNSYLYRPSGERKINDNALVALALLVAVSPSAEKELIIDLVKSLIA